MNQLASRRALPLVGVALLIGVLVWPAWGATVVARDIEDTCGDAADAGFTDVPDGNPHNPTIDCIKHHGITAGKTATTYDPSGDLRRDQLATFLAKTVEAGGVTLPEPTQDYYADDDGNPHEPNINKLAEVGIIDGSAGNFGVAVVPTRAEMSERTAAAMSYAGVLPTGSVPDYFSDDDGLAEEDDINRLAHAGVVSGRTSTTFGPAGTLRRDQMATFLARGIDLIADGGSAPGQPSPSPSASPSPSPSDGCDPSYLLVCIPSPPPDLNCSDITERQFLVIGADPHGFDTDNDGIGCES